MDDDASLDMHREAEDGTDIRENEQLSDTGKRNAPVSNRSVSDE